MELIQHAKEKSKREKNIKPIILDLEDKTLVGKGFVSLQWTLTMKKEEENRFKRAV